MNKLTKEQREQLISIAIGVAMLIGLSWYFGVKSMQGQLAGTKIMAGKMQTQLQDAEKLMRSGDEIGESLTNNMERLAKREAGLAPDRDTYAWLIGTFNAFLQTHKGVTIDSYSQADISDIGMIPKFPYRWATFHLRGSGFYHDLGKFFADLENTYPYFRIQNPYMAVNNGAAMEAEKLTVTFDLIAPIVSSGSETK